MIQFSRYPHVKDLLEHYANDLAQQDIKSILNTGIQSEQEADLLCRFVWKMLDKMEEDEENNIAVLGSVDNSDMIPDISYEMTKLMKDVGFYRVWESVFDELNN